MKIVFKSIGIFFVAVIVIMLISWAFMGNQFFMYKWLAPKMVQVQRETFEQSKSYNQGMIQELQNMQFEYIKEKDPKAQEALASIILHRVADFDVNKLPPDLYNFIQDLKQKYHN